MKARKTAQIGRMVTIAFLVVISGPATHAADRQILHGQIPVAVKGMRLQPIGSLISTTNLDLVIGLPLRNKDTLTNLLQQLYDPASVNFHQWLTPEQFTRMFGPTEDSYQTLLSFARSNQLNVVMTHSNRALLHVTASVSIIEKMLGVTMRRYHHPTENREFYAPDIEPSLDLRVPILYISGLDNFAIPRPNPNLRAIPLDKKGNPRPNAGSASGGAFRGNDFRAAYAPGTSLNGTGQTIGILQLEGGYFSADIQAYETQAGLPDVPLQNVYLNGYAGQPKTDLSQLETVESPMDIELAIAMAPGVSKVVIYGANDDSSCVDLLNEMANPTHGEPLPGQISTSYGIFYNDSVYQALEQMAAQGQSFFAYSGDQGAYADNANIPGPLPFPPGDYTYVTCVGGTELSTLGPGRPWVSETAWSGSGGGPSPWFSIPGWQQGLDMSLNLGTTKMRNCPDVAMVADNIFVICANGTSMVSGGTSASTPLWAGFTALINQEAAAFGKPSVGFINPAVYAIGQGPKYTDCFHDIVAGSNAHGVDPTKYRAVPGYDLCTGWGTPKGIKLIEALALQTALSAKLKYAGGQGCDPGPIAGETANYLVEAVGGAMPYTYDWSELNTPITSGGSETSAKASVKVPPVGASGSLSVVVIDASNKKVMTSIIVTGQDPEVAALEYKFCELGLALNRFKRPFYINPGDPGPIDFRLDPYSKSDLKMIWETVRQMDATIISLQRVGAESRREPPR
jgi:subtilase family serine protease